MATVATVQPTLDPINIRTDWTRDEIEQLLAMPLNDLLFRAHSIHRQQFDPNTVQLSTLLNIKSGGCPEDCAYCPQSVRYETGVGADPLLSVDAVRAAALAAKQSGATRFCMGAAWRSPKDRDLDQVIPLIQTVRELGMETCVTLGMLQAEQAQRLKDAGLDYYNHNLDTSPEFYGDIITTRTYDDRLETLDNVRAAGINVCCGGIIGMGESDTDRAGLLQSLANLPVHPESVPINMLVKVAGTPLENAEEVSALDMIRMVATARILMPAAVVRLSAGRESMSEEAQAMCFFAGANSIFYGDQLLTTSNPQAEQDRQLFSKLGITATAV